MAKSEYKSACGLDIGTMNLVSARQTLDGKSVETRRIRDAFLDLEAEAKKTLRLSKVDYVEKDGALIVLGDFALKMANLFKREVRRPLSRGVISAGELDAQQILSLLISNVVGSPVTPGEHCYYSVPAAPVDDEGQDIIYHQEVFRKILVELGYTPHPMNEAMAIIYRQHCARVPNDERNGVFGSSRRRLDRSARRESGWFDRGPHVRHQRKGYRSRTSRESRGRGDRLVHSIVD
jgi:hypothetical protein